MARTRAVAKNTKKRATKKPVRTRLGRLFYVFLATTLLYGIIVMTGPVDQALLDRYQLSVTKVHLLYATFVVPFAVIWLVAYYGYSRIKHYAQAVRDEPEGPGFLNIARGVGLLAFSLPLNSLISAIIAAEIVWHPSYQVPLTIFRNYTAMILPLLAFMFACRGAYQLAGLIRRREIRIVSQEVLTFCLIAACSLFTWLIIDRPADTRTPLNVYQLPNWLIVTTIVIPYVFTWSRGILAAFFLGTYQRKVKGSLYRKSLSNISYGFYIIIFANVLIQVINSVAARVYRLQLTPLLLIVYLLVGLYAVGFGLIASGAKKLKKIEDV